jgi:hypothetical protein
VGGGKSLAGRCVWLVDSAIAAGGRAAGRNATVAAFAGWIAAGLRASVGSRGQSAAVRGVVCGLAGGRREAGAVYNRLLIVILGKYPCVATGTYNNIITYIQNVSYIVIKNIS